MAKNEENSESNPIIATAGFGYDSKKQEIVYSKARKRNFEIGDEEIIIKAGTMTKEEFQKKKYQIERKQDKER